MTREQMGLRAGGMIVGVVAVVLVAGGLYGAGWIAVQVVTTVFGSVSVWSGAALGILVFTGALFGYRVALGVEKDAKLTARLRGGSGLGAGR